MKKTVISLFDYTGNWCRPYREAGWNVKQVDIKHGENFLEWDYWPYIKADELKVLIAIPCTDYALSGAKHFKRKDTDGTTDQSQKLVNRVKEVLQYYRFHAKNFNMWALENPMSRIHTMNPWLGQPLLKFDPCDYAGYDPIPDNSRYNKKTWLWGNFNIPDKKRMEPIVKDNPGWRKLGGKSEKTKELRSITPLGFAYAFYEANH
jgi:hypothetical protein